MFASVLMLQKLSVYLNLNSDESDIAMIHPSFFKKRAKLPHGGLTCTQPFLFFSESGWHLRPMKLLTSLPVLICSLSFPLNTLCSARMHVHTHRNKSVPRLQTVINTGFKGSSGVGMERGSGSTEILDQCCPVEIQ